MGLYLEHLEISRLQRFYYLGLRLYIERIYCKKFGALWYKIWSTQTFKYYKGCSAKELGHVGTKFGVLWNSTSTKVLQQKILSIFVPNLEHFKTNLLKFLEKIWGMLVPNLEHFDILLLQRFYSKKFGPFWYQIWRTLKLTFYIGFLAKKLGHVGTKFWALWNSTPTKGLKQKIWSMLVLNLERSEILFLQRFHCNKFGAVRYQILSTQKF